MLHFIYLFIDLFNYCFMTFKVQVDGGHRLDHFAELPVSLLLFCLICVDVIERIRPCKLTGPCKQMN